MLPDLKIPTYGPSKKKLNAIFTLCTYWQDKNLTPLNTRIQVHRSLFLFCSLYPSFCSPSLHYHIHIGILSASLSTSLLPPAPSLTHSTQLHVSVVCWTFHSKTELACTATVTRQRISTAGRFLGSLLPEMVSLAPANSFQSGQVEVSGCGFDSSANRNQIKF